MKPKSLGNRQILAPDERQQVNDIMGGLSFEAQKEQIRRANSILLARTLNAIETGAHDDATIANLAKCSNIAKQWMTEERVQQSSSPPDLSSIPTSQLEKLISKEPA
jgi:hypothetical protein